MKRYVARRASTIAAVLAELGEDASALADGRVFVGRTRVDRDRPLAAGDELVVHPPRAEVALPEPFVLVDGDGLLVVDKPAGIPTIPDLQGARGALIELASRRTGHSDLHPTSRLDREVSGVVAFARTDAARDALASAREAGRYMRRYVAIAAGELPEGALRWTWSIGRARDPRLRLAAGRAGDALPAATRARVVARSRVGSTAYALLAVAPETGRTHQIRVHAAAAGAPLVGDRAYGGPGRITLANGRSLAIGRVALHCANVTVEDGQGRCIISVASPVSPELVELARDLGLGTFEEALRCEL